MESIRKSSMKFRNCPTPAKLRGRVLHSNPANCGARYATEKNMPQRNVHPRLFRTRGLRTAIHQLVKDVWQMNGWYFYGHASMDKV